MKKYTYLQVKRAFGYRLFGRKSTNRIVIKTVLLMPSEIIKFVTSNCWFVSSFEDGWAFTLKVEDLKKGEYLIFLSDELLESNESQIMYTIAHEIGHVVLGHRNSFKEIQSKAEIRRQEKEADEFARNVV